MKTLIDQREIYCIPLVERNIYIENKKLIIEFTIIDDLNVCCEFSKTYQNSHAAEKSIIEFLMIHQDNPNFDWNKTNTFNQQKIKSMIKLFESILENSLHLPDNGHGFIYHGEKNHLREIMTSINDK